MAAVPDVVREDVLLALEAINGQDAYNVVTQSLGAVPRAHFLVLPTGYDPADFNAANVGSGGILEDQDLFARIWALNRMACPDPAYGDMFGLIRAFAVSLGWYDKSDQYEVRFDNPPAAAVASAALGTYLANSGISLSDLKASVFLTPMFAEFMFRQNGHHFITGQAADYIGKYETLARACLVKPLTAFIPANLAYHSALHWVTPGRAWRVVSALLETTRLPEAVKLRAHSAPAGTAAVSIVNACGAAMGANDLLRHMPSDIRAAFDTVFRLAEAIKADPVRYHVTYQAYNLAEPPAEVRNAKALGIAAAERLAPLCKGFIRATLGDASLGQARAIDKYAAINPMMVRRAERFFRDLSKQPVESISDLFATGLVGDED